MISKEDLDIARKQLSDQVEGMPEGPQKEAARTQLAKLSDEAVSAMVEQQRGEGGAQGQKSIFRMIVEGTVPSKKVDEDSDVVAVVSIRPVSKGHVIVIPKQLAKEEKDLPSSAMKMAKKISKKMVSKLKASRTEIQASRAFDEIILNVIPVYDGPVNVNSVAYEASEEELERVHKSLMVVKAPPKKKVIKISSKKGTEGPVLKLKRRVP
ncbi:MAG: HIT domain-containing protein [archaeon]